MVSSSNDPNAVLGTLISDTLSSYHAASLWKFREADSLLNRHLDHLHQTGEGVRTVCLAYDGSKVGKTHLFSEMPKENL